MLATNFLFIFVITAICLILKPDVDLEEAKSVKTCPSSAWTSTHSGLSQSLRHAPLPHKALKRKRRKPPALVGGTRIKTIPPIYLLT